MQQKIISMIFCANQGFIVHSPRLRSLFATRPYSFIKHHAMNQLTCKIKNKKYCFCIVIIIKMYYNIIGILKKENFYMNKYLVSETTKEERKEIIKSALGISLLGAKMPSDDVLELAKQYIDGNIEIDELQKRVLEKYNKKGESK